MKKIFLPVWLLLFNLVNSQQEGSHIAYVLWQDTVSAQNSIRLMRSDGSAGKELISYPGSNWLALARNQYLWFTLSTDTAGKKRGLYRYDLIKEEESFMFDSRGLYQDIDYDEKTGWYAGGFGHKPENRNRTQYDIFLFNEDGSSRLPVTRDTAIDLEPVFVPGTDRIIFRSNRDRNPSSWAEFEIYSIRRDGTDLKRLTYNPDTTKNVIKAGNPFITPDGRVVFTSYREGTYQLMVMHSDGSDLRVLLPMDHMEQTSFHFAPEGKKLVFTGRKKGERNNDIYIVNTDGTGLRQLTNDWRRKVQPFFVKVN